MALRLQGLNVKFTYKPGLTHGNADGLSRQFDDDSKDPQPSLQSSVKTQPFQDGPSPVSTMAES